MGKIADRILKRYSEAGSKPREKLATQADLRRLKRDLDQRLPKQQPSTVQTMGRAVRMMGRGFGNIGRSLNTPYDTRRPKISQLPQRRRDIGIVTGINLDRLKPPGLRKTDLRGKKTK